MNDCALFVTDSAQSFMPPAIPSAFLGGPWAVRMGYGRARGKSAGSGDSLGRRHASLGLTSNPDSSRAGA